MTILGLKCLTEDLMDKNPETANKEIKSLEIIQKNKHNYLSILFVDGDIVTVKLYEKGD